MILSIHDFPIRYEDNCIKNCKGEVILNFKRDSKYKIINFVEELIPAVNHGKRVFKRRLQKTFFDKSLEESLQIVKEEMINKGFILNKNTEGDIEYNIISKKDKNSKKLEFNIPYLNKDKEMIEKDFINKEFLQNCGDTLKILKKSNKRTSKGEYFYEAEFIKYPYQILETKGHILRGSVNNPQIEIEEFIKKEWPQNCGDSLRIIRKSDIKQGSYYLWECEFLKYPYKILAQKSKIIMGGVINPKIEEEFQNKIWTQNCGDSLRIIKKSNKKYNTSYLWECEFIKYPFKTLVTKAEIVRGTVLNTQLPWLKKENLEIFIKENYKKSKPTIKQLVIDFNLSESNIYRIINLFELTKLINYYPNIEENQVKDFIKSFYNKEIIKYSGKKEDNYYEIDIYLPELKKGIEYNGSNWHEEGNPNNLFSKPIGYHQKKKEFFAKKGIDILFVWDYEWFEDFPKRQIISEQTKQKIKDFLKF
jgi:DNA-directed RNA polymerase subunit H (RpoH/RPB5)